MLSKNILIYNFNRDPPPPYRSPPPPSLRKSPNRTTRPAMTPTNVSDQEVNPEAVSYNNQYRELVSLVNYQREKLSSQQVDLIKVY